LLLALASPHRPVRVLGPVVLAQALLVAAREAQLTLSRTVFEVEKQAEVHAV